MSINRSAGILLPISALPSNYGIGTLGKCAYEFVDYLVKAKQTYWQVLPVGHTSYGDSPYQCFSSVAGNPYFIDLDLLVKDKLLSKKDLKEIKVLNPRCIDYGYIYETRYPLLYKAYKKGITLYEKEFNRFIEENKEWLDDYALFMAIKKHFNMKSWLEWDDIDIKLRKKKAINKYRESLKEDILFYEFIQYLFFKQFFELKKYANENNIKIIGDIPIYVALDSCEVWADSRQFQLDKGTKIPKLVSGVPPDYFSEDGQLWGNPIYDWKYMKKTNYDWWLKRIKGVSKCFDVIRIDHFIGLERYWAIPYGDKIARNGHYEKGPSFDFVSTIKNHFKNIDFIAEDLGVSSEVAVKLLKESGFPGMRVLEFSNNHDGTSYHSPHNHKENCVCYVSTHDNEPVMGWVKNTNPKDLEYAKLYFNLTKEEGYNFGFIRGGMSSISKLFMCQFQDYLGLDEKATMNRPGTLNNWTFRFTRDQFSNKLCKKIALLTHTYRRDNNG